MTKPFERYRQQICQLYLKQNLTLQQVRKQMEETYGFYAQIRSYRNHLAMWGALKREHQSTGCSLLAQRSSARSAMRAARKLAQQSQQRPYSLASAVGSDSGYASGSYRASVSTLRSASWSDNASISDARTNFTNLTSQRSPTPSMALSNPSCETPVSEGGIQNPTLLNRLTVEPQFYASLPSRPKKAPNKPRARDVTNASTWAAERAGASGQRPPNHPDPQVNPSGYSPPHGRPSRCRLAQSDLSVPNADPLACQFCGATELHYLAATSYRVSKGTLTERIQVASKRADVKQCDIFGNNAGHFLAGSGPTMSHVRSFHEVGVDLFGRNLDGETFLHVLDPVRLGSELPDLLLWFHGLQPGILAQRTHHGKSVLHCLLERPCFLAPPHGFDALLDILPVFQSVKNDINGRDNQGYTAMELFCSKWLEAKALEERSSEELETFYGILGTFVPDLTLVNLGGTRPIPVTLWHGMVPTSRAPTGRHSEDLSLVNLKLRDREMRTTIAESICNPLVQDYRGRNGLHCLASVLKLSDADSKQPLAARRDSLVYLLNKGVDINAFDSRGETPLHTFLSYPRSHDEDNTIALFVKLMVDREGGADLHLRDRNGNDALHLACKSGRVPCVDILLALGANFCARNYRGRSPIAEAQLEMKMSVPEEAAMIQQCIDCVRRAGGVEDPPEEEDLLYNQNNTHAGQSLMEAGASQRLLGDMRPYLAPPHHHKGGSFLHRRIPRLQTLR